MVPMTFIWWIYHFWARFWPYFNFVDFRAYFRPFSLVNRVQFSNADAGAWNSFLRLGIIFYGKLMHKDTKFCYLRFDISTFGFKAPPYWAGSMEKIPHMGLLYSRWSKAQEHNHKPKQKWNSNQVCLRRPRVSAHCRVRDVWRAYQARSCSWELSARKHKALLFGIFISLQQTMNKTKVKKST